MSLTNFHDYRDVSQSRMESLYGEVFMIEILIVGTRKREILGG